MTNSTSRIRSAPLYSMLLRISVVICRVSSLLETTQLTIKQLPSALICTSPVRMPTLAGSKVVLKSRNFWLESALMGEV